MKGGWDGDRKSLFPDHLPRREKGALKVGHRKTLGREKLGDTLPCEGTRGSKRMT